MAIRFNNLNANVKRMLNGNYPDIGEVFYLVDSNFRTAAQGWSNAEMTGPLDLYAAYGSGAATYVYYAPGAGQPSGVTYATDAAATQAAIDAMTDFRGDTLFCTPGSYSWGAVVTMNVANGRLLGPPIGHPKRAAVVITDTVGDHVISSDDNEVAFIQFVPLTAQNFWQASNGADRAWFHHFYYNADGVSASTSTEFINGTASQADWLVEDFSVHVDAAQGDFLTLASPIRWIMQRGEFLVEGGTWASAVTFATTPRGNRFDLLFFNGSGSSSVLTNAFTGAADTMALMATRCYINGSLMTTASNIETAFSATGDIDIAECYLTGDATGEGGVVIALA